MWLREQERMGSRGRVFSRHDALTANLLRMMACGRGCMRAVPASLRLIVRLRAGGVSGVELWSSMCASRWSEPGAACCQRVSLVPRIPKPYAQTLF